MHRWDFFDVALHLDGVQCDIFLWGKAPKGELSMKNHLRIRALCEGALCVALAQILSFLKLFPDLANGGAITFAMFPICLYAIRWGLGRGLLAGFTLGLLQMIFDGAYAWGWQSMVLDYLVAYTPLGLAGLFRGKSWGIFPGTILGGAGRFLIHYISGVTIYRIYTPTSVPGFGSFDNASLYSLVYNAVYMVPCILLALAVAGVLFVPMKKFFTGSDIPRQ